MMQRQVTHMVRLVDDLLDVGRISQGKIDLRLALVDVNSVVQQAVDATRWMTEAKGQTLMVTLGDPIWVDADATRLAQVVGNLLHNACKFTATGGTIAITVERVEDKAGIRVGDSGCGIAADKLDTIFGMFMQLDTSMDRSNSGLGIGLTLARDLAVLHGGSIEAHSDGPGQGSEFVVQLPVAAESPPVPSPAVASESASIAGLHILVVDDNVDSAASLTMLLELLGGVTEVAHDGIEALRMAEATRPDVMILDIGLPVLNGYEVCRSLRSHDWGRRMTTIALTGWGQSDDIQRSADAGFDGHLVKPLDLRALQQLLSGLGVHGVS
jgi:CheY-like chemotaxis protein